MSAENKAVIQRLTEAFNAGDLDILDEIVAPDFVGHNPLSPENRCLFISFQEDQ